MKATLINNEIKQKR